MSRIKQNGVFQFHIDTKTKLLKYVLDNAENNNPQSVIETIDKFCWNEHWMMHVGDEKGKILGKIVKKNQPINILELGTYCGYSTILMLINMDNQNGKIYTIDPDVETITSITKQIIKKAGLEHRVVFIHGRLINYIQKPILNLKFDFVFLDHDKKQYLTDLLLLEKHNLLLNNTVFVADNVIIFDIKNYKDYVCDTSKFISKIYYTNLEYNNNNDHTVHADGIIVSKYI